MAATSPRKSIWPLAGYAVLTAVAFARRRSHPSRRVRAYLSEQRTAPEPRKPPPAREEKTVPAATAADASWWGLIKNAATQWIAHKDSRLGAALAYYSVFSLGPLIVIAVAIAGLLFGQDTARGEVSTGLRELLGDTGTQAIDAMLAAASRPREGVVATVIGIGTLIFAALGVVVQLKDALNTVWEVTTPPGKGIWGFARTYVLSLAGVLSLGFLLLISMLLTTALAAGGKYVAPYLPEASLQLVGSVVSFGVISMLFAMMFKWLPDANITWRCGGHRSPIRDRKVSDRALHRQTRVGIHVWGRGLNRSRAHLGLLLRANRPAWGRIYQRICQAARFLEPPSSPPTLLGGVGLHQLAVEPTS
jgi:uncharacterized BrkB/YihY/UPF0761 family membrane protein